MPVFSRTWLPPGQKQPVAWANPNQLRVAGPVLQVTISIPSALAAQLQQTQTPLPNPHTGLGLIDTGASVTSVDDAVFRKS